jgi:cell division protein FtsQ
VASGGRVEAGSRSRARTASVVVAFPRAHPGGRLDLTRLVPSGRALLAALALVAVCLLGYVIARNTGVFAVRTITVDGGSGRVAIEVRPVLREDVGRSLIRVDVARAQQLVESLPTVASASFDRAFPHTLEVRVVPERPVAVLRQGADSWLVSARGRVMARLAHGVRRGLPRIWLPKGEVLRLGGMVPGGLDEQLAAVVPLARGRLGGRVTSVRASREELTLILRSGLEVRLGDAADVSLKLAVAAKVIPLAPDDARYVDVSVPTRPVAGSLYRQPPAAQSTTDSADQSLNSQVETEGSPSSTP